MVIILDYLLNRYMVIIGYTLWLFNMAMVLMALIEIDGVYLLRMGGSFHGKLLVITRW